MPDPFLDRYISAILGIIGIIETGVPKNAREETNSAGK